LEKCLSEAEIAHLVNGLIPRDCFGPDTDFPCLAFDLGCSLDIGDWLADMPCPVIGVGSGPLANICDVVLTDRKKLGTLTQNIKTAPIAAMVLVQQLRASENLSIADALTAESFAYGTIQNGPEFMNWLCCRIAAQPIYC